MGVGIVTGALPQLREAVAHDLTVRVLLAHGLLHNGQGLLIERLGLLQPATQGVRKARTNGYLAAQVIRRHGLDAGVTPEMVTELDELSGKRSPTQSRFDLAFAWHVVRGWQDEDGGAA